MNDVANENYMKTIVEYWVPGTVVRIIQIRQMNWFGHLVPFTIWQLNPEDKNRR